MRTTPVEAPSMDGGGGREAIGAPLTSLFRRPLCPWAWGRACTHTSSFLDDKLQVHLIMLEWSIES